MIIRLIRSGLSGKEIALYLLIMLFALCLSFSIHEMMHAFVAWKLGDSTAKDLGRVTMNPASHVDPMGAVLLLVAGFGWGKPVPYNPNRLTRLKSKRLMCIMVHLAGVTGNFILALIFGVINSVIVAYLLTHNLNPALVALLSIFEYTMEFSLSLLAFNLLPIPPLDGFHVLEELLPLKVKYSEGYRKFMAFSPQILMLIILVGVFIDIPVLSTIINIIEIPFRLIIGLVSFVVLKIIF